MSELDGKVAIITGGGAGLGREHALLLAKMGARVVINDLGGSAAGEEPARKTVEEIKSAGGEAVAHFGDCADWGATEALFKTAVDTYGDLNILVNNAGFCKDAMLFNMSEQDFDAVVRVHLKGHFCNMRHAAKYWRDKSKAENAPVYGRMISTSSEAFLFGSVGQPNYAAAKAGIVAMTMGAAQALFKSGVTANVICPRARTAMTSTGPIAAMFEKPESGFDYFAPEHISPLVGYLASPRAANVSGEVFVVWGKQISVVQRPTVGPNFDSDEAWSVDGVARHLGDYFAKRTPVKDGFAVPAM
ncbi:Oxidoreductase, short chain dehydrogenase/reductase family [Sterolibacterium denitrificans]|uniref:3-ketoacyl-ACP reductase n=2 Tax=Sterolibacterium denitrificans TaxID=157592 RepID=A0A656Z969_9PROT|nr:SDR family NAD(P)-dependent oxidoreductase [Sterolibacterium denitrificans]KYC29494.1 3-ketoacyl-ACP reductase [Sterolibacterium denitrificans]SMB31976.1 Oxidoreductase, short chain dehydrogenase/reductase family [Sterolibacterium denitrificans]